MSRQEHNSKREFTPLELRTILHKKDLQDKVNLLVGIDNLVSFTENFSQDNSREYACILYIKSEDSLSHKSCILLSKSKQENGKVDIILSDAVNSASPLMIRELTELNQKLSQTNSDGRTFINKYSRLGGYNGCSGFAINDVIYYSNLEDKQTLTDRLYGLKLSETPDRKIIFYDLPPELMRNCQFLNAEKEESISAYLARNATNLTDFQRDELQKISDCEENLRNDYFLEEMHELSQKTLNITTSSSLKKAKKPQPNYSCTVS
jgi:hypothetical protein